MTNAPQDDLLAAMKRVAHEVLTHEERPGWVFRMSNDGKSRYALSPEGAPPDALVRLRVEYQRRLGATRLEAAPVDPADPKAGERDAVYVDGAPFAVQAAAAKKG